MKQEPKKEPQQEPQNTLARRQFLNSALASGAVGVMSATSVGVAQAADKVPAEAKKPSALPPSASA